MSCRIADKIYQDKTMNPNLWYKFFVSYDTTNDAGMTMSMGGSRVFGLSDNAEYYGLNGSIDKYKAVYETFGDVDVKAFPEVVPSYS